MWLRRLTPSTATRSERVVATRWYETSASRSARVVVATYCGIMWHLYPNGGIPQQFVAVDGSVYEKMPTIKDNMQKAIYEILGDEADKLELVLENGGSALGAALAAAMKPVEA